MEINCFGSVYAGTRVLITGHTGFKGSWLALWLQKLGAHVTGYSLPELSRPNHYETLQLELEDIRGDIRDTEKLTRVMLSVQPAMIFHLAAQSLVRPSYADPLGTWSTNVLGTASVLEAARQVESVRAIVAVTTDKVYENDEKGRGFKESDRLGGHDPYSASKAASEIVIESYRKSFFNKPNQALLASARAGNVIGGGDWSSERLIPDLVRSLQRKSPLNVRSPLSTRPWQHVLDCLSGYLLLGQHLLERKSESAEGWNFGPTKQDNRKVVEILKGLKKTWSKVEWVEGASSEKLHEAALLFLDSTKARHKLTWTPVWPLDTALEATAEWYKRWIQDRVCISEEQLVAYIEAAEKNQTIWCGEYATSRN